MLIDTVFDIIRAALGIVLIILITQAVLSWLIAFQIVTGGAVSQIYYALTRLTDPLVKPIRRLIPPTQGIDFSVMVVMFIILILQGPILNLLQHLAHGGSLL